MKKLCCLLIVVSSHATVAAQEKIAFTITGAKEDLTDVPICVPLQLAKESVGVRAVLVDGLGKTNVGQLTVPGITTEKLMAQPGKIRRDLHFVAPSLKAGESVKFTAQIFPDVLSQGFDWTHFKNDKGLAAVELDWLRNRKANLEPRPTLRYMCAPYDDATKESRDLTYKVFHHVYDPAGSRLVTNGGPTGLYPHHRGIMYGFNRCTYGDNKKADTWHCPPPVFVQHNKILSEEAGEVLGRHRVLIDWHGDKKTVFAQEERELTVYHVPHGTLVEFASRLKTTGGKVRLDGDPQHAGFQFRAANEVAEKTAKETYYLRPDGKGKPGETRNWDPKTKQGPVDLPWYAMSFVLGDKRYTACYLNHPKNPKETRFSERDYGRFGGYFEYDLTEDRPLVVNYRLWLQLGEMTGEEAAALSSAFASPPTAK